MYNIVSQIYKDEAIKYRNKKALLKKQTDRNLKKLFDEYNLNVSKLILLSKVK